MDDEGSENVPNSDKSSLIANESYDENDPFEHQDKFSPEFNSFQEVPKFKNQPLALQRKSFMIK
jgi:hypothetical protein